jgi:hypothetical protein
MSTSVASGAPGGVRAAAALITLGVYTALVCVIYLSPFALSSSAIQNDVYMSNLFLSAPLALAGVVCMASGGIIALRARSRGSMGPRMGLVAARALLVALVGAGVVAVAYALFGGRFHSFGPTPISWPPYLNEAVLVATLLVGLMALLVSLWWSARNVQR